MTHERAVAADDHEELEELRARIRELEAEARRLRDDEWFFRVLVDGLPQSIYRKDREGRCTYANATLLATLGSTLEGTLGKTVFDYYPRALAEKYDADERRVVETGEPFEDVEEHLVPATGETLQVKVIKAPVRDAAGAIVGTLGIYWDVTAVHTAERLLVQRDEQAAALRELGAPLIPIAEGVLAMPLIGQIDRGRAGQVLEALLQGVSGHQAAVAILDLTGVSTIDGEVASVLIEAARAVRLLGAEVVLTGMRPAMAQALVAMGVDLGGIVTQGTMQGGVAYALKRGR